MKITEDLVGRTFERLTVVQRANDYIKPNGEHITQWLCRCSCDNPKLIVVRKDSLISGHTKSCGCLQKENAKKVGKNNQKTNKNDLSGEYGILWSSNTNQEIYFDLKNANEVLKYNWRVNKNGYAYTSIDRKIVAMHVFLGYKFYDHHNRNKLDNREENMVPCTTQENTRNGSIRSNNTSGIIGVSLRKDTGRWEAAIMIDGRKIHLGYFTNKKDAIIARLKAEAEHFKDFAPQRHLFAVYGIEFNNQK